MVLVDLCGWQELEARQHTITEMETLISQSSSALTDSQAEAKQLVDLLETAQQQLQEKSNEGVSLQQRVQEVIWLAHKPK
jgi:hypothetical protein